MKIKRRVISHANMPVRLPVWQTVTMILVLDRFSAPGWLWGVALTFVAIQFVALYAVHRGEEAVDVLATKDAPAVAVPFVYTETRHPDSRVTEWEIVPGGHA